MHQYALWLIFTLCGLFAIVYKAVMAAGSELHAWNTTLTYFQAKPITTTMRFLIAQFGYLFVISNPAVLGNLLGDAMPGKLQIGPLFLAGMLGLASDKVADVFIVAGTWLYKKLTKLFGNGDSANGDPK